MANAVGLGSPLQRRLEAIKHTQGAPPEVRWYIHSPSGPQGPYDAGEMRERIRSGSCDGETSVNRVGDTEWRNLERDAALAQYLPGRFSGPSPTPYVPPRRAEPRAVKVEHTVDVDDLLKQVGAGHIGKPAGLMVRFFAMWIDGILLAVLCFGVQTFLIRSGIVQTNGLLSGKIAMLLIVQLVGIAYHVVFETGEWQATLGKRITKIYVRRSDQHRITVPQSIGRYIVRSLPVVNLISIFTILLGSERRAIHDMAAGTRVVYGKLQVEGDD